MIKRWFMMVMALVIALQSVAVVADVHQFHQSGTQHLEFKHLQQPTDTDNDSQLSTQAPDKPGQPVYDCHHCCHCHGHGAGALTGTALHLVALFSGKGQGDYQSSFTSAIPASLFRPPIA